MLLLALAIAAEPLPPRQLNDHMWTPDDYPRDALQKGESGRVSFVLDVNSEGRVTACTITASSGSSSLDEATCRLARRRARFEPARDEQRPADQWQLEQPNHVANESSPDAWMAGIL